MVVMMREFNYDDDEVQVRSKYQIFEKQRNKEEKNAQVNLHSSLGCAIVPLGRTW